jgi:hypothetical protein
MVESTAKPDYEAKKRGLKQNNALLSKTLKVEREKSSVKVC